MNNYITLDSKKYHTLEGWAPDTVRPSKFDTYLNNKTGAVYGHTSYRQWSGQIIAPYTSPGTGWGTIADLDTTLAKKQNLSFTSHDSIIVTVNVVSSGRKSLIRKWDAASNKWYVSITIREIVS